MIAYAAAERMNAGFCDLIEEQSHAFTVRPRWPLSELGSSSTDDLGRVSLT